MKNLLLIAIIFVVTSLSMNAQKKAEDFYRQGELKSSFFDNDGAITEYLKALEIDSTYEEAYNKIALIYFNKKDYQNAIKYMNSYIRFKNDNSDALYIRGMAKFSNEDFQSAINDFDNAIKINPKHLRSFYARGLVKNKIGNFSEAVNDFDATLNLKTKGNDKLEFADAYYNRAIAKKNLGKNEDACLDFKKAADLGSTESEKAIINNCK
ncbi:MAG: hypothetical protein A2046_04285 [Bacteroidetes bacterium GWA2_30_7]|nr:MAG: hypothetical protein A2046_04285 [Bacteroidetes bacterium GWA2_30_7]